MGVRAALGWWVALATVALATIACSAGGEDRSNLTASGTRNGTRTSDCPSNAGGDVPCEGAGEGAGCKVGSDCQSGVCAPDGTCAAPTSADGVKNGLESDVDCGGGEAPKCDEGKRCSAASDCFWGRCDASVCGGHLPGTKDGDQTDVDCGGSRSPACDWYKACLVDDDCTSKACGQDGACVPGASCKSIVHGGTTCGTGELGGEATHESCCRSLPVPGFGDPNQPGKAVYLDKYEITAGRMRAFVDAMAAANGGTPNVKAWVAANRPTRWNVGWEEVLPTGFFGSAVDYTIANPTVNPLYPGQDQWAAFYPGNTNWSIVSGNYAIDVGLNFALGSSHFFPEYNEDYAASHALNCMNGEGSYGLSTYWFDADTVKTYSGGIAKFFSKDQLDEKSLNCTPFALMAAFCTWDGGQLATAEVVDYVTGNTVSPVYAAAGSGSMNGKLAPGASNCGASTALGENSLITYSDSGTPCYAYYYPYDDPTNTYDGTSVIAPPGRMPADAIRKNDGDEEAWMDLIGNLQEAVFKAGETSRFDYRGFGNGYSSITAHKVQEMTPRMKGGSFGGRCMRFK